MAYQGAVEAAQRADRLPKGTSHASVVPPVHQSDSNDAGNGSLAQRFGWRAGCHVPDTIFLSRSLSWLAG